MNQLLQMLCIFNVQGNPAIEPAILGIKRNRAHINLQVAADYFCDLTNESNGINSGDSNRGLKNRTIF